MRLLLSLLRIGKQQEPSTLLKSSSRFFNKAHIVVFYAPSKGAYKGQLMQPTVCLFPSAHTRRGKTTHAAFCFFFFSFLIKKYFFQLKRKYIKKKNRILK